MQEPRLTFLLDVDNTLLDNDAAKRDLDGRIRNLVGTAAGDRFWRLYEDVRRELGMVNVPLTLARFETHVGSLKGAGTGEPGGIQRFELADLLMEFPYDRYLFPGALDAIAHLRTLGRVAILSDGDPTFQPSKIWRAGLDAAVGGYVLVFDHKEKHLDEVQAAFPADHYVFVDDKPEILSKIKELMVARLTTVFVRKGTYAKRVPEGWTGADLAVAEIADLCRYSRDRFLPDHAR